MTHALSRSLKHSRRIAPLILVAAATGGSPAFGADAPSDTADSGKLIAKVYSELTKGNSLGALKSLQDYQNTHAGFRQAPGLGPYLCAVYSQVGLHRQALEVADWLAEKAPASDGNPLKAQSAVDAIEPILRLTRDSRLVMVNEAHHVARHRAFMRELLVKFREQGFNHFAAETLALSDTDLAARGYPVTKTGFYSSEPMYGALIRTALDLGFKVIAYEPERQEGLEQREEFQANNLVEQVFRDNPTARLVVFAGYGHIYESTGKEGFTPLARRLKLKTGIDPVTVDQVQMRERASPEFEDPLFGYATDRLTLTRPSVFVDTAEKPWSARPDTYDVTVFQPRSVEARGRPTWMQMHGERKFWKVPADFCGPAPECLLKARFSTESDDAIPVDALLMDATGRNPTFLLLPDRAITLTATDANGATVNRMTIAR